MNRPLNLAAALALVLAPAAQAAEVSAIYSHGQDGEASYYSFRCSNGADGRVQVDSDPPKYCVQLRSDPEPVCRSVWRVEDAAAHGCRMAPNPKRGFDLPE